MHKEAKNNESRDILVNNAIANLYLYTLWHKDSQRMKALVPHLGKQIYSDSKMSELAADALWYLSSFGNDNNHEQLLTLEENLTCSQPIQFNWTEILTVLKQCEISYTDPLVWIKENSPYNPIKTKAGRRAA